jgi:hypothetical protein
LKLTLFLQQKIDKICRVIAFDEAHKLSSSPLISIFPGCHLVYDSLMTNSKQYMNSSNEASSLTSSLLTSIHLQRHLGTKVFISIQEPTISPTLLDLCSITIVYRFSSPAWVSTLKSHLAAVSYAEHVVGTQQDKPKAAAIFGEIVNLRVGGALPFCTSAITGVDGTKNDEIKKLGTEHMKVKIRAIITDDGGKSVMAG